MPFLSLFLSFFLSFLLRLLFKQRYLANYLSTHRHFSTKLILITTRSSTSTQRLHSFKFILVNKSQSQHSVVAVRCEGRHFLILYACVHEVSFQGQIPRSLVAHAYVYIALEIVRLRSDVRSCRILEIVLLMTKAVFTASAIPDKCLLQCALKRVIIQTTLYCKL